MKLRESSLAHMGQARRGAAFALAALAVSTVARAQPGDAWLTVARAPSHDALVGGATIPPLDDPAWTATVGPDGAPIELDLVSGQVVFDGRVVVPGLIAGEDHLLAFDLETGEPAWAAPIPPAVFDSWATPSVDPVNGTVLHGSDVFVTAIDLETGEQRWQTELVWDAVNAAPAVTDDLGPRDRAFITDFDPFVGQGSLYCINVDPFEATLNPFEPGEIVWSVEIGATGGASPAYHEGVVYAATTGAAGDGTGSILAFPGDAPDAPEPLWTFTNVQSGGFFGPPVAKETDGGVRLFAASFAFSGGRTSANLVKLDAATGGLLWSVGCNRTNTAPLVLDDGRVLVSGGLWGFGTVPTLQAFRDDGASATMLWDSAHATWEDADADGEMDAGEFLPIGGWTVQPLAMTRNGRALVALGTMEPDDLGLGPSDELVLLDLEHEPGSFGFVRARSSGAGNAPALTERLLIAGGPSGLVAHPTHAAFDVNADGIVDLDDLYAWERGRGERDVDGDGDADADDRAALIGVVRRDEVEDMRAGWR